MRLAGFLCAIALVARAQTFDVASVKVSEPIPTGRIGQFNFGMAGGPGTNHPDRITWSHATIKSLLVTAFDMPVYLFSGPDWLNSDMYEIAATMPPDTTKEQMRAMLRHLLEERFGMKVHREKKDLPSLVMTVSKGGPKMKLSASANPAKPSQKMSPGRATLSCTACSTTKLAEILTQRLNKPVTDATGLTGVYDFTLIYEPEFRSAPHMDGPPPPPPGGAEGEPASPIQSAIQMQLGLILEAKKSSVDIVVVDQIEKTPTGN